MNDDLLKQISDIKRQIETIDISLRTRRIREWGGADVIIRSVLDSNTKKWVDNQTFVLSFQATSPRRRVVITKHSKELSWLFIQLRKLFAEKLNYISKYDFYGLLAQSAIDYLANHENTQDAKSLLFAVLKTSEKFIDEQNIK